MSHSYQHSRSWMGYAFMVFVVTWVVFSPALSCGSLNWDDPMLVFQNAGIRSLSWEGILGMFTSLCASNYTPVERLSYALDWKIWGANPWGYHFTNILLHSLNASLVLCVARRLLSWKRMAVDSMAEGQSFRDYLPSILAALAFALHPLRVESVVWIAERRDVLSLFFLLLCVLFYLKSSDELQMGRKRMRDGWIAWLFFGVSLLSKASGVSLPFVLLLLDFYPLRRFQFSRSGLRPCVRCVFEKIPYFAAALAVGLIAIWAQSQRGAMVGLNVYPWPNRLANSAVALTFYVHHWIFPWPLFPLYSSFSRNVSFLSPGVVLSIAWLGLVSISTLVFARRKPLFLTGWWSYVVTILPLTGILQAGNQSVADRYSYLSTLPFAILLGAALQQMLDGRRIGVWRGAGLAILGLCLGIWGWRTTVQIPIWKDSLSLWRYAMREVPNEFLALNNYSSALIQNKDYFLAKVISRATTRVNPRWDLGWHNHGIALSLTGRKAEAIEAFRRALELNPSAGDSRLALGNLLFLRGDIMTARHHYFAAVQDDPTPERLVHVAIALHQTKRSACAEKYLAWAALQKYPEAYIVWGQVLASQGRVEQALGVLRLGYRLTRDPKISDLELKLERAAPGGENPKEM